MEIISVTEPSATGPAENSFDKKKPLVRIASIASTSSSRDHISSKDNRQGLRNAPIRPKVEDRAMDLFRTAMVVGRTFVLEHRDPYTALSEKGKWVHNYAEPLFNWWGHNPRVLMTACRSSVRIRDPQPGKITIDPGDVGENVCSSVVLNGASHNYAGLYAPSPQSEQLHRACLDLLPLADERAVPVVTDAARIAIASFFGADFCYCTSTGYGSNYVAFPAIVAACVKTDPDAGVALLMDDKCHNSIFTGAFLAKPACVRKFRHHDMVHLKELLLELEKKYHQIVVVIEGLYSMEGEVPDLGAVHRLKSRHNFVLFCDEAHSFLSIGRTGRGCVEFWNEQHPDDAVPEDLFDIRTATLSKAIGGLGGFICGKARFEEAVREHIAQLYRKGSESTLSYTMVQTLWVLSQPSLIERNLRRLHDMSRFCRAELARFGVRTYGDPGTPILPLFAGSPVLSGRLSYELRRRGLLATPVATPAVPYWESRVRVNLSAEHGDDEINALIDATIAAVRACGLCEKSQTQAKVHRNAYRSVAGDAGPDGGVIAAEAAEAHRTVLALISKAAADSEGATSDSKYLLDSRCGPSILQAGHDSRAKYGVGSGGARWVCGTFPSHLAAEGLLCEATGAESALTYADAAIGLASTVAALCRPLIGFRHHTLLVPTDASGAGQAGVPSPFEDGLVIAPKNGAPRMMRYQDLGDACALLAAIDGRHVSSMSCLPLSNGGGSYVTICLDLTGGADVVQLPVMLARLCDSIPSTTGATILIYSPRQLLGPLDLDIGRSRRQREKVQILACGSFYKTFGIPGGYLTGSATLIQELRYWSRGYMFTTSPPPFIMDMIRRALEIELQTKGAVLEN